MHEFRGGLAERREPLLVRQLFHEAIIQLANFLRRAFGGTVYPRALHIAADDLAHFMCVKRLVDVIVRAQTKSFLRRLQRAEAG